MRVTILGCGPSAGVPEIGNDWGRCDSGNPKNSRLRPSILLQYNKKNVLIDTSPDLRQQLLRNRIDALDGVLLTHPHADHLHGIDDLRAINRRMNRALPLWCDSHTLKVIGDRFGYVLEPLPERAQGYYYKPVLEPTVVQHGEQFSLFETPITVIGLDHGYGPSLGYRFGDWAYTTDLIDFQEGGFDLLAGVKVWLVSAFGDQPHPTHAHLDKVVGWSQRLKPQLTVLTHLSKLLDYDTLCRTLPSGIIPAFDGLAIEQGTAGQINLGTVAPTGA